MKKIIPILIAIVVFSSCKKEEDAPDNPYDSVVYQEGGDLVDTLDPNGIVAIHRDILLPKCSTPGCHDGTFEPDFRTVMSSYSTLVYHKIVKNNPDNQYTFRVIPFDTTNSVFQKRLTWQTFANTDDRMPQDNIGVGLPQEDLDRISSWILNGAQDPDGYVAQMPNLQPTANWIWVIEGQENWLDIWSFPINTLTGEDNREDGSYLNPMIVDTSMWIFAVPNITDDSTAISDLDDVRLEMSYDIDFGSIAHSVDAFYLPPSGENGDNWNFNFQLPNTLLEDTQIYLRIGMNDGDHDDDSYFPATFSNVWDKNAASIIIKRGSHP